MKARMRFHAVAAGIILAALSVCPPQARAAELEAVTLPGTGDSQDLLRALAQSYAAQYPGRQVTVPHPDGSNLQTIRKNLRCFAELQVTPKAHFNEHNADLVASMKTFRGAIGFMPLSEVVLHGYQAVTLDGTPATASAYPLGIGLGFVHRDELSPGTRAFLDYVETEPARDIMRKTGHVPVTK